MNVIEQARDRLASLLAQRDLKVVFAESCTGGLLSATLAQVSGISGHLCGSAVTYRPSTKREWLDIRHDTIEHHSCESQEVAREMVRNVMEQTLEADWGLSIVGHLEGQAFVWISIARRNRPSDGNPTKVISCSRPLERSNRVPRQQEAATLALNYLSETIEKSSP